MLVYANLLSFEPEDGRHQLIEIFSQWLSRKVRKTVDADRVEHGIRELNFSDGSILKSSATPFVDEDASYPYLFNAEYSHADFRVPGRRWILEFGMRQDKRLSSVDCSITLRTEDKAVRGNFPVMVTRPSFVEDLVEGCRPVYGTPGLFPKRLDLESSTPFIHEVERYERRAPMVVISPLEDGSYPLDPELLRIQVLGLADTIVIPATENSLALTEATGRRYSCFHGGVKIVWPRAHKHYLGSLETRLLLPEAREPGDDPNSSLERRILIELTNRMNGSYSLRHISADNVAEAVIRAKMYADLAKIRHATGRPDSKEYEELLDHADAELRSKDTKIDNLTTTTMELETEVVRLQAELDNLRALASVRPSYKVGQDAGAGNDQNLRESVIAMHKGTMNLSQALSLIQSMFPDRIEVLPSAFSSAKESDDGMFRHPEKAFDFLSTLATDYWTTLAEGGSEQQAKGVFGPNAYSATENKLTRNGVNLRTFYYHGSKLLMEKHLKYGVKDSLATTLRIHFKWIDAESKIVIDHCGKHLDF